MLFNLVCSFGRAYSLSERQAVTVAITSGTSGLLYVLPTHSEVNKQELFPTPPPPQQDSLYATLGLWVNLTGDRARNFRFPDFSLALYSAGR